MSVFCCNFCYSKNANAVYNFNPVPFGDSYMKTRQEAVNLPRQNLNLMRCENCGLLQLQDGGTPAENYSNYLYVSKVTNNLLPFYMRIARRLIDYAAVSNSDSILDIGCNDGSFLGMFKYRTNMLYGVDPSKTASKEAEELGVRVLNTFFDNGSVVELLALDCSPKIISCNYTLANISDLGKFFSHVLRLMNEETILNIITGYHLDQFAVSMFEYINHDHLTYLTLSDFVKISEAFGLKIIYANRHEHKGGSLEIGLALGSSKYTPDETVNQLLQREEWLNSKSNFLVEEMMKNVKLQGAELSSYLKAQKALGRKIVGVGASISSTLLISELGIQEYISYLLDDDSRKDGLFAPSTGIEVKSLREISTESELIIIIISWQHTHKILQRLRHLGCRGSVVIPLPRIKIMELSSEYIPVPQKGILD